MDKFCITRRQRQKAQRKEWSRNANARKAKIRIERAERRLAELEAEIAESLL